MIGITSNIEQVIEKFKILKDNARNVDFSDALVVGVNAAKAAMQNRIFNKGLDAGNTPIGSYKGPKKAVNRGRLSDFLVGTSDNISLSQYEKKRVKAGRQIRYKDLEFTGTLRRGIVVVKENQTAVSCQIPSDELAVIARSHEEYINGPIFSLTEGERELLREQVIEATTEIYDRLFNP